MFDWIWFDILGVIISLDQQNFLDTLTEILPGEDPSKVFDTLTSAPEIHRFETGSLTIDQMYTWLQGRFRSPITLREFQLLWCSYTRRNERALAALGRNLHCTRIGLASNIDPLLFAHINELCPELSRIHGKVLSFQLGVMKPDLRFFHAIIDISNAEPGQNLLIDDNRTNIAAAHKAGLRTLLFDERGFDFWDQFEELLALAERKNSIKSDHCKD